MSADFSEIPVAILAGGLATRLRPITEKIPKSLVSVAGKPMLTHQLELLHANGIRRVVLCIGHLGEMIQQDYGHSACGIAIDYSFDGGSPLGTGGAIRKALPKLGPEFFILYGDSYLPIDYRLVADVFHESEMPGLMTVYRNEGNYDTSNIVYHHGAIQVYDKTGKTPGMNYIDYGLSMFQAGVFLNGGLQDRFDLADLMAKLVSQGMMAGHEVMTRFYEMGSPQGLAELEKLLSTTQS